MSQFMKLIVTMALTIAITLTIITTTTTTTNTATFQDSLKDLTRPEEVKIRPSRFLAQKDPQGPQVPNPNAADHCNKDPEICNTSYYSTGANSTMACCNNKCMDLKTDDNNCGACKNKCKFGQTCCRGQCVYVAYDKRHCGQCNHRCNLGEYCVYGLCNYA